MFKMTLINNVGYYNVCTCIYYTIVDQLVFAFLHFTIQLSRHPETIYRERKK